MKRMRRGCDNYPDDGRYRIVEASEGWGFYVMIASDKRNEFRTYEYDRACGTKADIEKELREHSFDQIVKHYRDQYVYLECVEALR